MKKRQTLISDLDGDSVPVMEAQAAEPSSLVGEILECGSSEFPGQVLVRWQTLDGGLNDQWIPVVKGLALERGDLVLFSRPGNWPDWLVTHVVPGMASKELDIRVDGKRIEIEGAAEIVLRCGEASITLRRNGRLILRGTYVESRSRGTNRIKGGTVLIN